MFFSSSFLVLFGFFPVTEWDFINYFVIAVQEYRFDFVCAQCNRSLLLLFDVSVVQDPLLILFLVNFIFHLKRLIDLLDLFFLADLSLGKPPR